MTDKKLPPTFKELDARVRDAQSRQAAGSRARAGRTDLEGKGIGFAWRVGLELVSALIVGVGIGYMLDRWLGTKPWLLILFFILGSAAGLLNVFRMTSGMGGTVGYRRVEPTKNKDTARGNDEEDEG